MRTFERSRNGPIRQSHGFYLTLEEASSSELAWGAAHIALTVPFSFFALLLLHRHVGSILFFMQARAFASLVSSTLPAPESCLCSLIRPTVGPCRLSILWSALSSGSVSKLAAIVDSLHLRNTGVPHVICTLFTQEILSTPPKSEDPLTTRSTAALDSIS